VNESSNIKPEELDGDIRPDFVPANRYGPELFAYEKERLWPRIWHIAAREEEIPNVGDYVTYEILDESIILIRTSPDTIKAHYNVCQHRGRRLVNPGKGFSKGGFYCSFHGWKWDMEGNSTHVFHEEQWSDCPQFSKDAIALKQPKLESFGGWLWLNMDPEAAPLREWLGEVADMLEPFELEALRYGWYETIVAPVNWKVVIGAFVEGYHAGATHDSFVDYFTMYSPAYSLGMHAGYRSNFPSMPKMKREDGSRSEAVSGADMVYYQCKELYEELHAQVSPPMMRALERMREEFPLGSDESRLFQRLFELQREEIEATGAAWPEKYSLEALDAVGLSILFFPNTIVLPTVDAVLWYRLRPQPEDSAQCIFDIWCLNRYAPGAEPRVERHVSNGWVEAKGRNPFLEQDFANMSAVEMGMRSRGWEGARTNPVEEVTITHFHRMLDKFYAMPPL